ncbi:hypothetical protein C0J52_00478 [Blattella germanica]|nr:hypothetical protein C0J52_00478 [Blattella germanica]
MLLLIIYQRNAACTGTRSAENTLAVDRWLPAAFAESFKMSLYLYCRNNAMSVAIYKGWNIYIA